jgi:hypothetical protein
MGSPSNYSSPVIFTTLAQRITSAPDGGMMHDIIIYPNPAHASATLQFNADKDDAGTLSLYDVAGREVLVNSFRIVEGKNARELNLETLPQGIYLVVVRGADNKAARVNLVVE